MLRLLILKVALAIKMMMVTGKLSVENSLKEDFKKIERKDSLQMIKIKMILIRLKDKISQIREWKLIQVKSN